MTSRTRSALFILAVSMLLSMASGEKGAYRLANRHRREQGSRRRSMLTETISFSGDLAPIIEAAQALADKEASAGAGTPEPTLEPTLAPTLPLEPTETPGTTLLGCTDANSLDTSVDFSYSIETHQDYQVDDVIQNLEIALNQYLADNLLPSCARRMRRRLEADGEGIQGFDYLPRDEPSENCTLLSFLAMCLALLSFLNCACLSLLCSILHSPRSRGKRVHYCLGNHVCLVHARLQS